MKWRPLFVVVLLFAVTTGPLTGTASASPERIPVAGAIVGYSDYVIQSQGPHGSTYEIRSTAMAYWAGDEYLTGVEAQQVHVIIQGKVVDGWWTTQGGALMGTGHVTLAAFDGGWDETVRARIIGQFPDGQIIYEGTTVGHGWGELEGWLLRYEFDNTAGYLQATGTVMPPAPDA